jgi:hypothetical protein
MVVGFRGTAGGAVKSSFSVMEVTAECMMARGGSSGFRPAGEVYSLAGGTKAGGANTRVAVDCHHLITMGHDYRAKKPKIHSHFWGFMSILGYSNRIDLGGGFGTVFGQQHPQKLR